MPSRLRTEIDSSSPKPIESYAYSAVRHGVEYTAPDWIGCNVDNAPKSSTEQDLVNPNCDMPWVWGQFRGASVTRCPGVGQCETRQGEVRRGEVRQCEARKGAGEVG